MVGGLIQEQDIGITVDQLAKPYLGLFSTAQDAYLAFDVLCGKSAFSQCGTDLILCVGRKILPELFDTGGTVVAFHFPVSYTHLTYVGTWSADELSTDDIIAKMVGRTLTNVYPERKNKPGEVVMEVKHMTSISDKSFQDVSFNLRKGEILGFGGLVGAQRTEVLEGVFGIRALKSGEVYVKGKKVTIKHPADAMKAGIGLITDCLLYTSRK